jgi:hypothetical protein
MKTNTPWPGYSSKRMPDNAPQNNSQQPWKHSARSRRLLVIRGSDISGNRLFAISCASHMLALAARALIRAVGSYRLFNFQSESVQVLGRPGEHLSFSIGDKITQ